VLRINHLRLFSAAKWRCPINHLVANAYPDCIRPRLLKQVAAAAGMNPRHVGKVSGTALFRKRQRQCLFLGLSDGARTDLFRRNNSPEIKHEQVLQTYEISGSRVAGLLEKLGSDLEGICGGQTPDEDRKFRTVVLLDDFSASGKSYIRKTDSTFEGKIGTFFRSIADPDDPCSQLADMEQLEILVVLYVGTRQAREHLDGHLAEMLRGSTVKYSVLVVHELNPAIRVQPGTEDPLELVLEKYYDESLEDESTRVGGTNLKYGFSGCGLPVVLSHNTPNNSVYLLWAESAKLRGLFPRISRHRREG
jgi:hypothetical protein